VLANDAATYAGTIGLRGSIRFTDVNQIPHFYPDPDQKHTFVDEWISGVPSDRMIEWQLSFFHEDAAPTIDPRMPPNSRPEADRKG
jgi:hypothetical protein